MARGAAARRLWLELPLISFYNLSVTIGAQNHTTGRNGLRHAQRTTPPHARPVLALVRLSLRHRGLAAARTSRSISVGACGPGGADSCTPEGANVT